MSEPVTIMMHGPPRGPFKALPSAEFDYLMAEARMARILLGAYAIPSNRDLPFGQVLRDLGCDQTPLKVPVEIRLLPDDPRIDKAIQP